MNEIWNTLGEAACDGFFAAIAAIGFSIISNPPLRTLPYCALLAAVGHATRFLLISSAGMDIASASFSGAFLIGWLSLPFASIVKSPTTTLYIPALLPMVPGMFAYKTILAMHQFMTHLNDNDAASFYMNDFLKNGVTAFTILFGLAVGASLPTLILRRYSFSMTRNKDKKRPATTETI